MPNPKNYCKNRTHTPLKLTINAHFIDINSIPVTY